MRFFFKLKLKMRLIRFFMSQTNNYLTQFNLPVHIQFFKVQIKLKLYLIRCYKIIRCTEYYQRTIELCQKHLKNRTHEAPCM